MAGHAILFNILHHFLLKCNNQKQTRFSDEVQSNGYNGGCEEIWRLVSRQISLWHLGYFSQNLYSAPNIDLAKSAVTFDDTLILK